MKNENLINTAKIVSNVFTPFILSLMGVIILLTCSYLNLLPWQNKMLIIILVLGYTLVLPLTLIHLYRSYMGWGISKQTTKEERMIPYVISILCYLCCFYHLCRIRTPHSIGSIIVAALLVMVTCSIINIWWKISIHSAAVGGATGAFMAYALIFNFNPVWWLCLIILFSGFVGTSRLILRQHSLAQVVAGYVIGLIAAIAAVLYL